MKYVGGRRRRPRTYRARRPPRPEERAESLDRVLPVLRAALEGAGAEAVVAYWDDSDIDWAAFDLEW